VDSDVTVGVEWQFGGSPIASSDRVMISPVATMRPPFTSTLTLSPLTMSDGGQYTCQATADSASPHVTASMEGRSSAQTVTVAGNPETLLRSAPSPVLMACTVCTVEAGGIASCLHALSCNCNLQLAMCGGRLLEHEHYMYMYIIMVKLNVMDVQAGFISLPQISHLRL